MAIRDIFKKILLGSNEPIPDLGRNEPCWCGSEKKYKHCHQASDDRKRQTARATAAFGRDSGEGFGF